MLPWNNTVCSIFTKLFVTCLNPWYIVTTWTVWSSKSFASFFDRQYCLFTRRTWIIITWYWVLLRPVDEVVVRRGDKPAGASGPGIAGMHPYGGGDRMVQVSRLYALHRWGHSPLVERSISLCWVIGGLWVEARLWLTSRQRGLPPVWLLGLYVGCNPSPSFPYLSCAVPWRHGRELWRVKFTSRRHWGIMLVLCDLAVHCSGAGVKNYGHWNNRPWWSP